MHTILLRSDGSAVAFGCNRGGQCDIPPLDEGVTYTHVPACYWHTVLLRSDGLAVACGLNRWGQCDIPPLGDGITYTQVSAGHHHTVFLRSDGSAVACGNTGACGSNSDGPYEFPSSDARVTYSRVCAGGYHTVLLRSDGSAVACGTNQDGQCKVPPIMTWLEWFGCQSPGLRYVADVMVVGRKPDRILQLDFLQEGDAMILRCVGLDGDEVACLRTRGSDLAVDVFSQLTRKLKACREENRVVLPDGQLLNTVCSADPFVTLGTVHLEHGKP
eukprot:Skav211215  [mRNA]  locus=scaffold934:105530:106348:- [translate_table: standard]